MSELVPEVRHGLFHVCLSLSFARKALPTLETLDFIKNGRNLILYGNPGTGKTHLATALGIAACNAGHSVLFTSVPRLLTQIRECRNALTLRSLENKFERYDMVICRCRFR